MGKKPTEQKKQVLRLLVDNYWLLGKNGNYLSSANIEKGFRLPVVFSS